MHTHISKKRWVKLENTFYRGIFIDYCKSNEQFWVWNPSIEKIEIQTHLVFIEHEKGSYLLINSEQYNKNWETSVNLNTVDNDYSSVLTSQKLVWRCTESERVLFRDFKVIRSVRDISELSVRIQRLGLNTENQNKNSHTSSENSENDSEAQSSDSETFRTIYIDTKSVRETLKSVKETSTEKMSCYRQILRLNSWYVNMTIQKQIHEPFTYKEAMRSLTYHCQWAQVIEEELRSLTLNETWELMKLLKECLLITFKWVFKMKYTFSSLIEWFKTCLMIRDFSQQYEIDYKEIFALTLHFDSLCMLLTIAAHKDLHIH